METLLLYIPLMLGLYMFTHHLYNKIQNLPPSPFFTLPILGHLYLLKKPLHRTLSKISHKYGPILLLKFGSRRVLVVSSPSAAEECFTKNDIIFANRPCLLAGKHLGNNHTTLSWAPYGDHWRNLRRITSLEVFSTHRLNALQSIRAEEVRLLIKRLTTRDGNSIDMKSMFFELTLNIMMRMISGKRYYGENVVEAEEVLMFREVVRESFRVGGASNMEDFLPAMKWLGMGGSEKKMMVLKEKRDGFLQGLIEELKGKMVGSEKLGEERKKTTVEVLLSLQEKEPQYYTDELIKGIILVSLVAGTDTSVGTMEWALSLLLNHGEILKKAQAEIDNHVGKDRLFEESDVAELPYLRCIISETLRMYPAGPLLAPHESSEDCTVGGYLVPRGTMLLVNIWAIQNDPNIWVDPHKFDPKRFQGLQGTRDGFKLMPFGSGRRGCPGEGLAMRVVGLTLGSLLQCFDLARVTEEMIDMTEGNGLTMPKAQSLVAICQPRSKMAKLLSQI